jgi:tetratricopeptide (TPR) repeat protein/TolB-like protein/predicted Ser/Thr protein kinase
MADSLIGRRLSHYEIVEELGRGGMGVVYRAIDTSLGREIALKVLPDDLVHDKARRDRLLHEARAASLIEHPHIAVIHEVGEIDGVAFIAMELIRGEKLSDVLSRGPLPPKHAIDLAIEIGEGLGRAHDKGLIHRDLKPANVMITEDGHAKVIDFGLAKVLEPVTQDASTASVRGPRTDSGVILGTAAYMSPEQARGLRVDPRSDIFSFGVMLYEMLTGRAAFQGGTSLDTMHAILTLPMPPLPAIGGFPTDRLDDIRRVIDKATAKDPKDRYQGVKDVVVDLRASRRLLESSPASAVVEPALAAGRARPRRISTTVIAGVLALLAAGAAAWWFSRRGEPAVPRSGKPAIAVLYFENHTGDASLDWMRTGLADMMVTDLSQVREIEVLGTDRLYQILAELRRADDRTVAPDVIDQVARRAGVDTLLVGSYIKAGDAIRINARLQEAQTGRVVTSERVEGPGEASLFSLVDELTRRIRTQIVSLAGPPAPLISKPATGATPALDRDLADVTTSSIDAYRAYVEAMSFHERGLYSQAIGPLKRAVEIDPQFAMAFAKLAVVHSNIGLLEKRDEYAKRAVDLSNRLTTRERYYIEGLYYTDRLDTLNRGLDAYKQGLVLHPEHHAMRHNLGLLYFQLERFPESIEQYEELIRRGTTTASTHGNLADAHVAIGQSRRAREILEAYLRQYPESGTGLTYLAGALIAEGRIDEARAAYQKASALNPASFGPRLGLWTAAMLQDRWSEAELPVKQMAAAANPFEHILSLGLEAELNVSRGRSREALELIDRAVRHPASSPEDRTFFRVRQGTLLLRQRRAAAALAQAGLGASDAQNSGGELTAAALQAIAQASTGQQADADKTVARLESRATLLPGPQGERLIHWARGEIARARGDRSTAAAELTKAQSMLPVQGPTLGPPTLHPTLWFAAATANLEAGRDDEAAKLFERLQSSHERIFDVDAYARSFYLLGQIYERRGDTARAQAQYKRFLDLWRDGDTERGWVADAQKKTAR